VDERSYSLVLVAFHNGVIADEYGVKSALPVFSIGYLTVAIYSAEYLEIKQSWDGLLALRSLPRSLILQSDHHFMWTGGKTIQRGQGI